MNIVKKGVIFVFLLMFIQFASAEIMISQPKDVYNFGDEFNVTISIVASADANGFLAASLVCPNREFEMYKSPQSVKQEVKKEVLVAMDIDRSLFENALGSCYVKASYGNESVESRKFLISNSVKVTFEFEGISFEPKSSIMITGKALKENGESLEGFVELSSETLGMSMAEQVKEGKFSLNLILSENSKPGDHEIKVKAYEKSSDGKVLNSGEAKESLKIKQIVNKAEVVANVDSIKPGNEISYIVNLYDQAGNKVKDDVGIQITKPNKEVYIQKVIKSDESQALKIENNFAPQYWKIEATTADLSAQDIFYVEELESATFAVVNGSLVVTNTGNVPYRKPIEILLGEQKQVVDNLNIDVGDEKKLKLVAGAGEYAIRVKDGGDEKNLGSVVLTGNALGLGELGDQIANASKFWGWILLIIVLIVVVGYYYMKIRKKKYVGKEPDKLSLKSYGKSFEKEDSLAVNKSSVASVIASNPVNSKGDGGVKEECAVIALKIKNSTELNEHKNEKALSLIKSILSKAKLHKANVYGSDEFKIIIFSPSGLNQKDATITALRFVKNALADLEDYNRRYVQKIRFGIGVNSGEIIIETRLGQKKFNAIGNTIILSKRIADAANQKVFLSESIHNRASTSVKAESIPGQSYWKLNEVVDRKQHDEFLKKFMKRNDFD